MPDSAAGRGSSWLASLPCCSQQLVEVRGRHRCWVVGGDRWQDGADGRGYVLLAQPVVAQRPRGVHLLAQPLQPVECGGRVERDRHPVLDVGNGGGGGGPGGGGGGGK